MSEDQTAVPKHVDESDEFLAEYQKYRHRIKNGRQIVRIPNMIENRCKPVRTIEAQHIRYESGIVRGSREERVVKKKERKSPR